MSRPLEGKVAIVTGAAQGMGTSIAQVLAEAGARVAATDINEAGVKAVALEIGGDAIGLAHDVTSAASWAQVIAEVEERLGTVGVLVNNAGVAIWGNVEHCDEDEARHMVEVDFFGVFQGLKAIVPAMRRNGGGAVVNIASCAATKGTEGLGVYSACKWAVRGLAKCFALEVGDDNIRINSVHPGMIDTAMTTGMDDPDNQPIKRKGAPREVAQAVLFLASDASSYSTGADFIVDGGMSVGVTQ